MTAPQGTRHATSKEKLRRLAHAFRKSEVRRHRRTRRPLVGRARAGDDQWQKLLQQKLNEGEAKGYDVRSLLMSDKHDWILIV